MFPWNLFPFNKDAKSKMSGMKPADIQNYVQEMMEKMMPESLQKMDPQDMFKNIAPANNSTPNNPTANKLFNYAVFETHYHCFVRIPIVDEAWLKNIKVYYTSNQVIIQHIPAESDKHIITLPSVVRRKGSTAAYKDNILEIKIQKSNQMNYSEIDVTEIQ